jgi:hypothetical protein
MSTPEHHKFMQQVRQDKVQRKKLGIQERMAEGRAANLANRILARFTALSFNKWDANTIVFTATVTDFSRCRKKSDNAARLRMKKQHGNKKRARSGGGGRGGE